MLNSFKHEKVVVQKEEKPANSSTKVVKKSMKQLIKEAYRETHQMKMLLRKVLDWSELDY